MSLAHAWVEIAALVEDCNRERPHSSYGYATPAAIAAKLDKQSPVSRRPTGSATSAIASAALMRKTFARLLSQLGESWESRQRQSANPRHLRAMIGKILPKAFRRCRPRSATAAQILHKSRVSERFAPEGARRYTASFEIRLNLLQ